MKKSILVSASLVLFSAQAVAQVRPQDCRPVFPVVDHVEAAVVPDVVTEQAPPTVIERRRFVGLPFLIPLVIGGGFIAIITHHGGHHHTVSPA
jgi:hypothetical protein